MFTHILCSHTLLSLPGPGLEEGALPQPCLLQMRLPWLSQHHGDHLEAVDSGKICKITKCKFNWCLCVSLKGVDIIILSYMLKHVKVSWAGLWFGHPPYWYTCNQCTTAHAFLKRNSSSILRFTACHVAALKGVRKHLQFRQETIILLALAKYSWNQAFSKIWQHLYQLHPAT